MSIESLATEQFNAQRVHTTSPSATWKLEEEIGVVLSSMLPVPVGRDGMVTTMPPYNVIIECSDVIGLRPRIGARRASLFDRSTRHNASQTSGENSRVAEEGSLGDVSLALNINKVGRRLLASKDIDPDNIHAYVRTSVHIGRMISMIEIKLRNNLTMGPRG
ncbi:hypothetical protein CBL_01455 [Carabus blaptoides fortunei]